MQIVPASIAALNKGFSALYQQGFTTAQPWHERISTVAPSTSRENVYGFLDKIPKMREWLGERVFQNLVARGYTIVNRPFELSIEVDREEIEDDQLGMYTPVISEMGAQAAKLFDDLLVELLQKGVSTVCHDGQYFFDTDHPVNMDDASMGTQSNSLTGTALTASNYEVARAKMASFKGADGRPLGASGSLLVVPPALEVTAKRIVSADLINGGDSNVLKGTADVLVIPELAGDDDTWYLLDTKRFIKPFVCQQRKAPEFVAMTDPTSENVFRRKKFQYGVDARSAAGYGLWFLALRAKA